MPALIAIGLGALAIVVALLARRNRLHLLDAFRALDPRTGAAILAWIAAAVAGRLAAATAIGYSLALRSDGVSFAHGLAAGIALHAVEIAVGLTIGTAGVLSLGVDRVRVCTGAIRS